MKERPIIFSAPMVRAILDGRETQTRRVVKLTDSGRVKEPGSPRNWHLDDPEAVMACPYGVPGDRLWVREAWAVPPQLNHLPPRMIDQPKPGELRPGILAIVCYREGYAGYDPWPGTRWRPSIHMPRWASRLTLEIVSVRVERVQEISEKDALAEGALEFDSPTTFVDHGMQSIYLPSMGYARASFMRLWDSINAKRAPWDSNPWVWVIEFRRAGE